MTKNVILLAVDDLIDVVRFGNVLGVDIQTPNIDRLRDMGVTFENSFTPVPLCSPARTATLTGRSPFSTGVQHNEGLGITHVATPADTILGAFHEAGFYTALRGKMFHGYIDIITEWLGDTLDEFGGSDGYLNNDNDFPQPQPADVPEGDHLDAITAGWAANFIETYDRDTPFFLSVGIRKPHLAWDVPQEYFDLYNPNDIELPEIGVRFEDLPVFVQNFIGMGFDAHDDILEADVWAETIQAYLAAVSFADAQVGRVLDAVDWDTTTLAFFSDHGYHLGDRDNWQKFTLWEEAASVPFIIADPDLGRGEVVSTPASLIDLWPTLAALTGIEPPADSDGVDLFSDHGREAVLTTAYGSVSIRTEEWRYTIYQSGEVELFEVKDGGIFEKDISGREGTAETVEAMHNLLVTALADQYGVTLVSEGDARGNRSDQTYIVIDGAFANGKAGDDFYYVSEGSIVKDKSGYDGIMVSSKADWLRLYDGIEYAELAQKSTVALIGNALNNTLLGNTDANLLAGRRGNDILDGRDGGDTLRGGLGDDRLRGGPGQDTLWGSDGDDALIGGMGQDALKGGEGNDILRGNKGNDTLKGGNGADRFVFVKGDEGDTVIDFEDNIDTLVLDESLWCGGLTKAEVLERFGAELGGSIVLDFGHDELTIDGVDNLEDLRNDIDFT